VTCRKAATTYGSNQIVNKSYLVIHTEIEAACDGIPSNDNNKKSYTPELPFVPERLNSRDDSSFRHHRHVSSTINHSHETAANKHKQPSTCFKLSLAVHAVHDRLTSLAKI
jgi:hypothetical protein